MKTKTLFLAKSQRKILNCSKIKNQLKNHSFEFQLSWRVWKKMMYTFWIIVIGFSMLSLTMIYTYQFDGFDELWEKYIHIDTDL